jgi:NhaA family Na+:H+ antiporter
MCGIGFTMSLFIGTLAFEETGVDLLFDERVGIIVGSICSAVLGYAVLNSSLKPGKTDNEYLLMEKEK